MLAQLDMPAMVLTVLALLLFLRQHCVAAACVNTLLVLVRETGIVVAALFLFWLVIRERRLREASYFLGPFVALGVWLFILKRATGHWLGGPVFASFNLAYSLNPARAGSVLVRRLYYLFVAEFRWIGTLWIGRASWTRYFNQRSSRHSLANKGPFFGTNSPADVKRKSVYN
jgi:hypothetical protein